MCVVCVLSVLSDLLPLVRLFARSDSSVMNRSASDLETSFLVAVHLRDAPRDGLVDNIFRWTFQPGLIVN